MNVIFLHFYNKRILYDINLSLIILYMYEKSHDDFSGHMNNYMGNWE